MNKSCKSESMGRCMSLIVTENVKFPNITSSKVNIYLAICILMQSQKNINKNQGKALWRDGSDERVLQVALGDLGSNIGSVICFVMKYSHKCAPHHLR